MIIFGIILLLVAAGAGALGLVLLVIEIVS